VLIKPLGLFPKLEQFVTKCPDFTTILNIRLNVDIYDATRRALMDSIKNFVFNCAKNGLMG